MKYTHQDLVQREFCGARTRAGTPCRRKDLYENGRCRLHGGWSTGPRTPEGKVKVTQNLPWVKKRESQLEPGQDQTP